MLKHKGTTTIATDRLILRKFKNFDIGSVYRNWASDYETVKQIDFGINEDYETIEIYIMDIIFNYSNTNYDFAIEHAKTKEVIGSIQLVNIDEHREKCELGFVLGSKFWNKGYMSEAISAILKFCFLQINFARVESFCLSTNIASQKVLTKCGMYYEGLLPKGICIRNKFSDAMKFAITNNDYFA